jgi:hypothetical protein
MLHLLYALSLFPLFCFGYLIDITVWYPGENLFQNALTIRGDNLGLNWNSGVSLVQASENSWKITFEYTNSVVGATFQFKILVDDQLWMIGSNAFVTLSGEDMQVEVYPFFTSQVGNYQYIYNIYSPELNNYRDLVIYTPPSYNENTLKQYPFLIMHDGQNLFNSSTSFNGIAWNCQETVNALVNEGLMEEVIIVGVDNTPLRIGNII